MQRSERGFTLIELLVVVLIIAILVAIALPQFLGARTRAQDGAAKAMIREALAAELVYYGSEQAFTEDDAALEAIEPDITWGTLATSEKGVVASLAGGDDQVVILRSESETGTVFCMGRTASGDDAGTTYTTGCTGAEDAATVAGWPTTIDLGW